MLAAHLLDVAARAASVSHDGGFGTYRHVSDRPPPAGDADTVTRGALAAGRDALLVSLASVHPLVEAGDMVALDTYERHMRALSALVRAWHELHRRSA